MVFDWKVYNECLRKKAYHDKSSAEKAIKSIKRRGVIVHRGHVYKCANCCLWHIGRSEKIEEQG